MGKQVILHDNGTREEYELITSDHTSTPPVEESWERFDEKFNHFNDQYLGRGKNGRQICNYDCSEDYNLDDVKSFLQQEIDKAYVEGYKHGSGSIAVDVVALKEQYDKGYQKGREEEREKVTDIIQEAYMKQDWQVILNYLVLERKEK